MRLPSIVLSVVVLCPALAQYKFSNKCGTSGALVPRLFGGRNAEIGEVPWQASLQIQPRDLEDVQRCGGVLVHPRLVLTAAHCVAGAINVTVTLGDHDLTTTEETDTLVTVAQEVEIHPGYGARERFDLDAAAIILRPKIPWSQYPAISPACFPPGGNVEEFINKPATVSGWGIKRGGRDSNTLQVATVTVFPPEQCSDSSIYGDAFTSDMLCAGDLNGSVDTCAGDSGGPLVSSARDGMTQELVGLVSYGKSCGRTGYPGVYTKITAVYSWLKKLVRDLRLGEELEEKQKEEEKQEEKQEEEEGVNFPETEETESVNSGESGEETTHPQNNVNLIQAFYEFGKNIGHLFKNISHRHKSDDHYNDRSRDRYRHRDRNRHRDRDSNVFNWF